MAGQPCNTHPFVSPERTDYFFYVKGECPMSHAGRSLNTDSSTYSAALPYTTLPQLLRAVTASFNRDDALNYPLDGT